MLRSIKANIQPSWLNRRSLVNNGFIIWKDTILLVNFACSLSYPHSIFNMQLVPPHWGWSAVFANTFHQFFDLFTSVSYLLTSIIDIIMNHCKICIVVHTECNDSFFVCVCVSGWWNIQCSRYWSCCWWHFGKVNSNTLTMMLLSSYTIILKVIRPPQSSLMENEHLTKMWKFSNSWNRMCRVGTMKVQL